MLEMIETASRNYLGQNFSDGASSPDSFTSEPIQFATAGPTTVTVASSTVEQHNAQPHPTYQATPVTPVAYPVKVPGVRVTSRTNTVSPQKTSHSLTTDPSRSGQLQHAASFDNIFGFTPNSARSSDHSRSFDHSSGIVRKLFSQNEQNDTLSHSLNYPASDRTPSSVPLRAVSLDEVEKQMTAEVSSPEANIPFSFLNSKPSNTPSEQRVLLQPSMFDTATPSPVKAHSEPVVVQGQPSSISVQPPTPVTSQFQTLSGHEQSFPPVPPLMHSAGMKAAPKEPLGKLSSVTPHQTPSQTNGQPRRASSEPTSQGRNSVSVQPTVSFKLLIKLTLFGITLSLHSVTMCMLVCLCVCVCVQLSPLPELSTSRPRSTSPITSTLMSPHQFRGEPAESAKPTSVTDKPPLCLTREQMVQAFEYLLKVRSLAVNTVVWVLLPS